MSLYFPLYCRTRSALTTSLATLLTTVLLWHALPVQAQVPTSAQQDTLEQRRAQEREAQLRKEQERTRDKLQSAAPPKQAPRLPEKETPCVEIRQLELRVQGRAQGASGDVQSDMPGDDAPRFGWVLDTLAGPQGDDSPLRKCIGGAGIGILQERAQAALLARGYVTTRLLAQSQDLRSGTLALVVVPGRVHAVRSAPESANNAPALPLPPRTLRSALPMREGDILNLRDLDQALENFQRVPTTQVEIEIAAPDTPAHRGMTQTGPLQTSPLQGNLLQSDLIIHSQSGFPLRASMSLDDSGSKSTGRYQASATLSWDNPLGLNDLFYIAQGNDAQGGDTGPRGNQSTTLHYSLPWGYWSYGVTLSENSYYQTITGSTLGTIYSGASGSAELKASHLFYRDAASKNTVYLKAQERHARNYINGTEVLIQRRATALWELGVEHKKFIGQGTLQATLAYKRGTRDFDALDAPEESAGQGTARPSFYNAELNWSTPWSPTVPWTPWALPLAYQASLRLQATDVALSAPDRFGLGGRYTVRGFDGENSVSGDAGWLVRQDIGWNLGQSWSQLGGQLYVALDAGEIDGPNTSGLPERFIAGTAIGWRIQTKKLQFDCFVGHPLHTPTTLRTSQTAAGFYLNYSL